MRAAGAGVLLLRAAASDADSTLQLALGDRAKVDTSKDVGASAVPTLPGLTKLCAQDVSVTSVRSIDLARVIYRLHRNLQVSCTCEHGTAVTSQSHAMHIATFCTMRPNTSRTTRWHTAALPPHPVVGYW